MDSDAAKIFRALGDENRIEILGLILECERNASDILKNVSIGQSTLSHHMKILCDSGIVSCRRSGKQIFYSLSKPGAEPALSFMENLFAVKNSENHDKKPIDVVLL